ncbi:hypothetical protein EVG20_g2512 [Dentipellis fragilis]|uniref:Aminotransferase class I/classII domain-containing protein n=1 Tax=Dentipellis fragilis TaxID=205917 RepID=A0A4Y9Z9H3_9AGAM|nr:hypothetical protein EVG20_g2512 [Dentipellis fragilis]
MLDLSILKVQYAVRGELAIRADSGCSRGTLNSLSSFNQQGCTSRQIAALVEYPALMDLTPVIFPKGVIAIHKELQNERYQLHRRQALVYYPYISAAIHSPSNTERDGFSADPNYIFPAGRASAGFSFLISTLISSPQSGVLILTSQYPFYATTVASYSGAPSSLPP